MSPENDTPQHDDEPISPTLALPMVDARCLSCAGDADDPEATMRSAGNATAAENRDRFDLRAALDVIGRRTDIVAVQLPEPEPPRVSGSFPCWELAVGNVLLDSAFNEILVAGLTLSPRHAGELAAALLAAKSISEAASDGAK